MALKSITCPWCGREARITYEENRVYQMKCYSCHNTMLHVDHSFDSAVEFFEHHAKLLQADKDGRMVVLPCKVGDTVYVINRHLNRIFECTVISICVGYSSDLKNYIKTKWMGAKGNESIRKWTLRQIGRYVFLTREEAEAELKGGES